jgi:DnaJ-class molecular chaperone
MKLTICPICLGKGETRNKKSEKELCWQCEGFGKIVDLTKVQSYSVHKVAREEDERDLE